MQVVPIKRCPHCEKEYYDCEIKYPQYVQSNLKVVWKKCDLCNGTGSITQVEESYGTSIVGNTLSYTCNRCGGSGVIDSGYFTME